MDRTTVNVSVSDIADGQPFEMELYVSVHKQYYNGPMEKMNIIPNCKAKLIRDVFGGDVKISFENLSELKSNGIIQSDLNLSPIFDYTDYGEKGEVASAEVGNSFAAMTSGKEYISLFQVTRQHGAIVAFLINNLPNVGNYYYLIILNEKKS